MNPVALLFLALIPLAATSGLPRNALLVVMTLCAVAAALSGVSL